MKDLYSQWSWHKWQDGFAPKNGTIVFVLQKDKSTLRVGRYKSWDTPSGPAGQVESLLPDEGLIPLGIGWLPKWKTKFSDLMLPNLSEEDKSFFCA